jgi:hypothetical protein
MGIPVSVYAVSDFLAVKMTDAQRHKDLVCSTLLNCAGTYRKPVALQERAFIKNAGFCQSDVELGLPSHTAR